MADTINDIKPTFERQFSDVKMPCLTIFPR